jgi:S-adenosylmethionine:tRNA ribosyltransferase-isomerase
MKIEEFDYTLPKSLIAQYPPPERGASRLMVVHRNSGTIEHRAFHEFLRYVNTGDLLVINNTRVLPARLIGKKETGGRCEVLLIPQWNGGKGDNGNQGEWKALIKGIRDQRKGSRIQFEQGVVAEVNEIEGGKARIRFSAREGVVDILRRIGHIPLPPYIKRSDETPDRARYQTVFAERDGSIAAPTAGLHFTEEILQSIKGKGAGIASITLHVGPGTFIPVKAAEVEDHSMESEWTDISQNTSREIGQTKQKGGRVIAVGTTTIRALESFSNPEGQVASGTGFSSLFIRPPYPFRVVDGLVTNFHLPKSTLILLVSAFAGRDLLMKAYQEAVKQKYRFYSYGDAMLIL